MKLSNQAIGSIMMALQKGAMAAMTGKPAEECDITKMLQEFELEDGRDGLIVINPPTIVFDEEE
jgi:hypothetical protein